MIKSLFRSIIAAAALFSVGAAHAAGVSVLGNPEFVNAQTGTTYTAACSDLGDLLTFSNTAGTTVTLPQGNTTCFLPGAWIDIQNKSIGPVTLTPTTSTFDGTTSLVLQPGAGITVIVDASGNYTGVRGGSNGSGGATLTKNLLQDDPSVNQWQTGTANTAAIANAAQYVGSPDLWFGFGVGASSSLSTSKTTAGVPVGVAAAVEINRTTGTDVNALFLAQEIATSTITPLQGQTAVCSFKAKADAGFSAASSAVTVKFITGTGTDEGSAVAITGFTGAATPLSTTIPITTSWASYVTAPFLIATTATEAVFEIGYVPVGTGGATDDFQVTQMQCELGASATSFERQSVDLVRQIAIEHEYCISEPTGGVGGNTFGQGQTLTSTTATVVISLPESMRTAPSVNLSTVGSLAVTAGSTQLSLTSLGAAGTSRFTPVSATLGAVVSSGLSPEQGGLTLLQSGPLATGKICFSANF